jgi:hypothetical protein
MELKETNDHKNVYIKSCKSHVERLIELNARTILRQLPTGRSYRVNANGRIIERTQRQERDNSV